VQHRTFEHILKFVDILLELRVLGIKRHKALFINIDHLFESVEVLVNFLRIISHKKGVILHIITHHL